MNLRKIKKKKAEDKAKQKEAEDRREHNKVKLEKVRKEMNEDIKKALKNAEERRIQLEVNYSFIHIRKKEN